MPRPFPCRSPPFPSTFSVPSPFFNHLCIDDLALETPVKSQPRDRLLSEPVSYLDCFLVRGSEPSTSASSTQSFKIKYKTEVNYLALHLDIDVQELGSDWPVQVRRELCVCAWRGGTVEEAACAEQVQDQTVQTVPRHHVLSLRLAVPVRALHPLLRRRATHQLLPDAPGEHEPDGKQTQELGEPRHPRIQHRVQGQVRTHDFS